MSMIQYIDEIKRQLITVYKFQESPTVPGIPLHVPDGDYPMKIGGKLDLVKIINGKIHCCNFVRDL